MTNGNIFKYKQQLGFSFKKYLKNYFFLYEKIGIRPGYTPVRIGVIKNLEHTTKSGQKAKVIEFENLCVIQDILDY